MATVETTRVLRAFVDLVVAAQVRARSMQVN
jgi:hypothetical protein